MKKRKVKSKPPFPKSKHPFPTAKKKSHHKPFVKQAEEEAKEKNEEMPLLAQSDKKTVFRKDRVPTGIHNLDNLIQGGFKEGSVTLLVASPGSGKTIFSFQFLLTGLQKGENCLYLTFEEKKGKLYDDMLDFGWNFAMYEKKKQFFELEYNPEQVKSLIEEGGGTVDLLITKYNIKRLVIDSITSFELLYQDDLARKQAGLALFELINKWGCTAILTSQAQSRKFEPESDSLQFEADNIILLYHFKKHGHRIRGVEILKMRGTRHTNKTMGLEINNKGMTIKPGETVALDEAEPVF